MFTGIIHKKISVTLKVYVSACSRDYMPHSMIIGSKFTIQSQGKCAIRKCTDSCTMNCIIISISINLHIISSGGFNCSGCYNVISDKKCNGSASTSCHSLIVRGRRSQTGLRSYLTLQMLRKSPLKTLVY